MWIDILYLVIGLIVGFVVGLLVSKKLVQKQLKDNPPINEEMIKTLMMQMGRKPSEAQVRAAMKAMNQYK